MKTTSKKTIKRSSRERKDHAAGCRLNDEQRAMVLADAANLSAVWGTRLTMGTYVKNAVLRHQVLRETHNKLSKFVMEQGFARQTASSAMLSDEELLAKISEILGIGMVS